MKNHPKKRAGDWRGQYSSVPADRIDDRFCALLRNCSCDRTGRIVKSQGVGIVATAASFGLVAGSSPERFHSLFRFTGRQGAHPNSKAIAVLTSKMCRSRDNDLFSRWDDVTYASTDETPTLDRAAACVFRNGYAYIQNGTDFPMRLKCEQDDGGTLTTQAETLGLRPPCFSLQFQSFTAGNARRFPPNVNTSYVVTFVYGVRGESGPGPTMSLLPTTGDGTNDTVNYRYIPLGPTGCTARRIYRSKIGQGAHYASYGTTTFFSGPPVEMYLLHQIEDNTTTTFADSYDDAQLDYTTVAPSPRPLVPRAKYETIHLGRIFWANVKDHPWTIGLYADPTRAASAPFTDYRVTISNTGNGTITLEKFNAGWTTDLTVSNYKTKSLADLVSALMGGVSFQMAVVTYSSGICTMVPGALDRTRTYTFNEVVQKSIFAQPYWAVAQDNVTGNDGPEVHVNRFYFADPVFPEQVDPFNSDDLTQGGSNEITGMAVLDNALVLDTFEDSFAVSGDFVPDPSGLPTFRVDRIHAQAGSICQRPDAVVAVPALGLVKVSKDALRSVRGEQSVVAGEPVADQFARVLREPPARDNVAADYDAGIYRIAVPTGETP